MVAIPVQSEFKIEDYWQFKALSIEWLYMMQKLKDSLMPPPGLVHCVMGEAFDGNPLYLLHRKAYTAETLSKATGISAEKLTAHSGVITLRGKKVEGLPMATVDYWGNA